MAVTVAGDGHGGGARIVSMWQVPILVLRHQCPHRKGDYFLLTGQETGVGEKYVGGAGPCWSGQQW